MTVLNGKRASEKCLERYLILIVDDRLANILSMEAKEGERRVCTLYLPQGQAISDDKRLEKMVNIGIKVEESTAWPPERSLNDTVPDERPIDVDLETVEEAEDERPELKDKNILVIDDDVRNIYALVVVLEPYGVNILSADNGEEALMILQEDESIDAVIMDVMLPRMDGYEAMGHIRGKLGLKRLPIIALTGKVMMDERKRCLEAGANEYLSKPIEKENILNVLQTWLYEG